MSNLHVSAQAFLQEIQSWTITLGRQAKKLKSLKPQVRNKFKLNSIEIVLTEIDSLQIKYKKIKNKYKQFVTNGHRNFNFNQENQHFYSEELLAEYSQLSKSFMDVLQKVALIEAENNEANLLIEDSDEVNFKEKRKQKLPIQRNDGERTFLNQTFSFKASKQNKNHSNVTKIKNKSIFDKRNSYKEKEQNTSIRNKAHSLIGQSNKNNLSLYNPQAKLSKLIKQPIKSSSLANEDEDTSLWQIRHQLSKITQMMKEMKNQIKFHQHQETNKQINKIENKNRKIASELKSVKQENRVILQKIDSLKTQLMQQKKMQVDLINRFQKKSHLNNTAMYDSRATHGQNYRSINQDISRDMNKSPITNRKPQTIQNVSDWVRMRI